MRRPVLPRSLARRPAAVMSRASVRVVAVATALAVAATGAFLALRPKHVVHVTAHFTRAVGVYAGSDVRMLGVKIGTVTRVTPEGASVRAELEYDAEQRVPADAVAVIVPPSLVSDRYVQLAPVYRSGPVLADGADIPLARTASPVELDEIYRSLDDLAVALGPAGANRDGALSRLLAVGADNLRGNGAQINQTIGDLDKAVATLSANRGDLFASVSNLQKFVSALAQSDAQVRQFNSNLASVAQQLAAERVTLAAALKNLAAALDQVTTFVHDNRALLKSNITGLSQVTTTLVRQRAALAEFLDVAPTALSNLANSYNPRSGTLDVRNNFNQLGDPAFVCALLMSLPVSKAAEPVIGECQQAAQLSQVFAQSLGAALRALGLQYTPPAAPTVPGQPGAAAPPTPPTGQTTGTTGLPTIPGATAPVLPGAAGALPTIPGVTSTVDGVTSELSDSLGSVLGGGR